MEEAHKERRIKTVLNLKRDMEANEVRLRLCVICAHLEVTVRILYFAISCILPVVIAEIQCTVMHSLHYTFKHSVFLATVRCKIKM